MEFFNLFCILFIAMLVAFIIGKDMEDVLPSCLFVFLIVLYGIAILGKSHHSYLASILLLGLVWVIYVARNKRIIPKFKDLKEKLLKPGLILYLVVVLVMFVAYSNHFVTVWDDFHYNATFPKDMYYYGTMPTGFKSATFYKSYLPLMQLFFYWGFQGIGDFSEVLMFRYKIFLIFTCLLLLFKQVNSGSKPKRICSGIIAILLPFSFMYELMESLSMDTFMALVFSYALILILYEKRDWFCYVRIGIALVTLSLIKQIAPLFTAIALGTWFIKTLVSYICADKESEADKTLEKKNLQMELMCFGAAAVCSLVAVASWKVFCKIKGNTVYLSNKLSESTQGGIFNLPDYGRATISDFIKSIFTLRMGLNVNGISLGIVLIVSILIMLAIYKLRKGNAGIYAGFATIILGLIGYLMVLLYTYIFVFEQWEAESLSSIDRYFGTYAIVLILVPFMGLMQKSSAKVTSIHSQKYEKYSFVVIACLLVVTFPVKNAICYLIPKFYMAVKANQYQEENEALQEVERVHPQDREARTVLLVTNEENTLYSRTLIYDLIPFIPTQILISSEMDDMSQMILDICRDEHVYYVYFPDRLIDDGPAIDKITGAIENDIVPEKGHLYYYDENDEIIRILD